MAQTHAPYPASLRADAVKLVPSSSTSVRQVAADLGVSVESLRSWVRQAKGDAGEGPPGALPSAAREELRRLRREHRTPLMERESLKEAAAFLDKETA